MSPNIHIHPLPQPFDQRLPSVKDRELDSVYLLAVVKRTYDERQKMLRRSSKHLLAVAKQSCGIYQLIVKMQFFHLLGYIPQALTPRACSHKDIGSGICRKSSTTFQSPY